MGNNFTDYTKGFSNLIHQICCESIVLNRVWEKFNTQSASFPMGPYSHILRLLFQHLASNKTKFYEEILIYQGSLLLKNAKLNHIDIFRNVPLGYWNVPLCHLHLRPFHFLTGDIKRPEHKHRCSPHSPPVIGAMAQKEKPERSAICCFVKIENKNLSRCDD